jgi:hypothetical protein
MDEACRIPQIRRAFPKENDLSTSGGEANKPPRSGLKGVRVLVVEDHWHVANSLKLLLETEGMEVSGPAATTADACRLNGIEVGIYGREGMGEPA